MIIIEFKNQCIEIIYKLRQTLFTETHTENTYRNEYLHKLKTYMHVQTNIHTHRRTDVHSDKTRHIDSMHMYMLNQYFSEDGDLDDFANC